MLLENRNEVEARVQPLPNADGYINRILDMSRTALNVTGDLTACVVMDRWLGDTLKDEPASAESTAA